MFEAAMRNDFPAALALQDRLIRLHRALFIDASPAPTKFALSHLGLCAADCRLPIVPCDPAAHAEILAAMAEAGVVS
jgi:4-hydroxy-tetrahydrodipicolinate synthase